MTERTCSAGGALRFLVSCTVTVALVAATFVAVPAIRAAQELVISPEDAQSVTSREIIVKKPAEGGTNQPFASSNDECSGADVIPAGTYPVLSTTQNIGANTDTGDPAAPTCALGGNDAQGAAWWKFTPTETNTYFFNTCTNVAPGTTHDDTIVAVYSSSDNTCAGTLGEVGCSDDSNACPGFSNFLSNASAFLTSGQTYYVVVWNWAAPPGTADVQIQVTKSSAPANDSCTGAVALPLNRTVRGTLLSATNTYSLSDASCFVGVGNNVTGVCLGGPPGSTTGRDIVYSFTAPAAGSYSIRARNDGTAVGANTLLYTSSTCPAPGVITCPAGAQASNKNFFASNFPTREERSCIPMASGETVYAIIDECNSPANGGPITIEASPCFSESEPNDTPATASAAPFAGVSPVTGAIGTATDVDFFSLGAAPSGSRVFAHVDANSSSSAAVPPNPAGADSGDFDLRVTTATDTLEYDQNDSTTAHGGESAAIAGRRLTGVPSYLRINNRLSTTAGEPYLLYSVVQPPGFDSYGSSASTENNEGINDDFPGAETAGNLFWAGTLFNSTDLDLYRICAAEGDMIHIQSDSNPTRTGPPGKNLVTGFSVITGGQLGPFSANNPATAQVNNTTLSPGTLTGVTPFSPSESWLWRAEYNGPHFGYIDMRGTPVNGQDYLLSVAINGQTGAEMSVDLQLTKSGPDTAAAGDVIVYTLTLTNNGPSQATFANFFDQLPDGTAFAGFGLDGVDDLFGSCEAPPLGDVGGSLSCTFDCLPPGRTVTVEIAVQVFQCIGDGFVVFNQAFANTVTNMAPESVTFGSYATTITDNGSCDADGDACTVDFCDAGVCVAGPAPDCDDDNVCTSDSCDSVTGCVNAPNTEACSDNNACTAGDICGGGSCQPGAPVDPNDNNACTTDSCDPGTGVVNAPNTNPCSDGNACTAGDVCGGGSCQPGAPVDPNDNNVCTTDACDPGTGVSNTPNSNPCSDSNACTAGDICSGGSCQPGAPVDPNDNNPCTNDSCNPGTGVINAPNTNPCSDGNACTNGDICGGGSCQPGAPVNPNDNNPCTDDSCNPGTGVVNTPNTAPCTDGNACTVGDTCGGGSCQSGGPLSCDDGNVCTTNTCNPGSGCQASNNTLPCDDGDPGTVNDTCSGGVCTGESACEPHGRPRSRGYYERLCHRRHSGDWLSDAQVACVAEISDTFAYVDSIQDVCDELQSRRRDDDDDDGGGQHDDDDDGHHINGGHGDGGHDDDDDDGEGGNKCEKAEEDLMATALNICKQKVCLDQGLDSRCNHNLDTVGESFSSADALLANPNRRRRDCKQAQCQAREINNGRALDWNSLSITHVANQIRLDWEAPLVEEGSTLSGYRIYRRNVGTQEEFTEIGTSPTPHFVDPTGVAGAHEYEIVGLE